MKRNFRINERLLEQIRTAIGCKGCEAKINGDEVRTHSNECRARIEEAMQQDEVEMDILTKRDSRRVQKQRGNHNKLKKTNIEPNPANYQHQKKKQ